MTSLVCAARIPPRSASCIASTSQVGEVGGRLRVRLHRPSCGQQIPQLNQRRNPAPARLRGPAENTRFIPQPERTDAARVVDGQEKVQRSRDRRHIIPGAARLFSSFRVVAHDDAPGPPIGFRVGDGGVEDGALLRLAMELRANHQPEP
ncbi:MAG: hypothetical protein KY444_06805, partial [Gemmatimonadetes bacterium]|nr:hypothetical protein [Gemmatimonadota bacterium]